MKTLIAFLLLSTQLLADQFIMSIPVMRDNGQIVVADVFAETASQGIDSIITTPYVDFGDEEYALVNVFSHLVHEICANFHNGSFDLYSETEFTQADVKPYERTGFLYRKSLFHISDGSGRFYEELKTNTQIDYPVSRIKCINTGTSI